jgi:hypothetical protein
MVDQKKRRLINILQILTIPIFLTCGFGTISGICASPRSRALEVVKEPIPPEWEFVIVSHGRIYPWPFGGKAFILFGLGAVLSMAFLIVSACYSEDWTAGKPLFGWLKPW